MSVQLETIIPLNMAQIKFGPGATEELGYELKTRGVEKVLLVVDRHLWDAGLVDQAKTIIEDEGIQVSIYDQVRVEPTDESFTQAAKTAGSISYDALVALGGGSTIDTAKAINLLTTHGGDVQDYINKPIGGGKPVPGPMRPLFALPTTSGTGSETTPTIALEVVKLRVKTGMSHVYNRPTMAIVDPINTVSMPPAVTAYTGLDIFTHAAESFTIKPFDTRLKAENPGLRPAYIGANPISDLWCEKAIEWMGKYIRRAYYNGYDMEARLYMSMAASFAGIGFGNAGVHIPHALGYPIAGMVKDWYPTGYDVDHPMVPHGVATAITAPASFRFTAPTSLKRHARLAQLLGVNTDILSEREAAMQLPETLVQLLRDLDCPNGLSELGYTAADIPTMVEGGWKQQRLLIGSPRPLTKDNLRVIFEESMVLW
ncbi:MAG: iron-containing alcohol dehydrogenase [Anaerolineales bacterium]|nr:iron-containing alcohol dehydrogenase [Anaerolineales bacterium]